MWIADHKKTLKLPILPPDASVRAEDMIGIWDENVATDDDGVRWYPVKWNGRAHKRKLWESGRG